jgi:catechol 2,3-dioxygenase
VSGLGIDRAHYTMVGADDPVAASRFAVETMGLSLVHVDGAGRHYLAAHGLDPYSLVYAPGERSLVHISFLVRGRGALDTAAAALADAGVDCARVTEHELWRHAPALRFTHATGATIELTTGVQTDLPLAWEVAAPRAVPGPITLDHVFVRAVDVAGSNDFNARVMGLRESARIVPPDDIPILTFFRAHTLWHCFGTARSPFDGLHHIQFTLKNDHALFAAHEAVRDRGVEIVWGPVRHGAGQNIAFYFHDAVGNLIEFSSEEELVLNDDTYTPDVWPLSDPRATDEWGSHPPEAMK